MLQLRLLSTERQQQADSTTRVGSDSNTTSLARVLYAGLRALHEECGDAAHHLESPVDLIGASTPERADGRLLLVTETCAHSLDQDEASRDIGRSLASMQALTSSLLAGVSALNSTGVYHKYWRRRDIRLGSTGAISARLCNSFVNNVAQPPPAALADMFVHPAFIPPEVLLAGPAAFAVHAGTATTDQAAILLKTDVYQLAILLLWTLRGSLPLPPPSSDPYPIPSAVADAFSHESIEELWAVHFGPQPSSPQDHPRHDECQLCTPESKNGAHSDSGVAQLCTRCWLNIDNLEASFASDSSSPPLSLLAPSLARDAAGSLLAAYSSFLALLRLLLAANPLERPSAAQAMTHAFFASKWSRQARGQALAHSNARHQWRKKAEAPGAHSFADGLNSLHTELNQIALDPLFGRAGFKAVQAVPTQAHQNGDHADSSASPQSCAVCHQPLSSRIHPSSPGACHCLLPFSARDLYSMWRDTLRAHGHTVYSWLEERAREQPSASDPPATSSPLVTRANVMDSLPAVLLGATAAAPSLHAIVASPASNSTQAATYFVPLLPLYHLLRATIVQHHDAELATLWAELEIADQELERSAAQAAAAAKPVKIARMRKADAPNTSPVPTSSPPASQRRTPHSSIVASIRALVSARSLLRLYPATRTDLVRLARDLVSARDGSSSTSIEQWRVFRSASCTPSGVALSAVLRRELWPCLLGVRSGAAKLAFSAWADCSLGPLLPHAEDEQVARDVQRLGGVHATLNDPLAQLRVRRLIRAVLARTTSRTYWQGMHELAAVVWRAYPQVDEEPLAVAVLDALLSKPFLAELYVVDNAAAMDRQQRHLQAVLQAVDPQLHAQLDSLQVSPALYALPWLLTGFAHVLPLDATWQLWDVLLAAGASTSDDDPVSLATAQRDEYRLWVLASVSILRLLRGSLLAPDASFQSAVFDLTHRVHTLDARELLAMLHRLAHASATPATWEALQL